MIFGQGLVLERLHPRAVGLRMFKNASLKF